MTQRHYPGLTPGRVPPGAMASLPAPTSLVVGVDRITGRVAWVSTDAEKSRGLVAGWMLASFIVHEGISLDTAVQPGDAWDAWDA